MRIFQDFSAPQILHDINFGHFKAQKTASWTILVAQNFDFLENFDISKCELVLKIKIQSVQNF